MMVLHANLDRFRAPEGIPRRHVVGMQVVRNDFRRDAQKTFQSCDRFLECLIRVEILEVADVRADVRSVGRPYTERVLQERTARQHRPIEPIG